MPSSSKSQQRFFGVVKSMQKGDLPKKGKAGKAAKSMTKKDVDDFASTKHKGLPNKVKRENRVKSLIKKMVREEIQEQMCFDLQTEKCWKGYEKKGTKMMFGKRYPNCVKKEGKIKEDYKNSEWEVYVGDDPYGKNRKVVKVVKSRRAAVILYNKLIKTDKYAEVGMRVVKEAKLSEGVADEIRKQIPRRTMSYVGARNFAKGKTSKGEFLEFSVKGSRLKTGGKVRVTYNKGGDDYTIEAFQIRGTNVKLIKKKERIQVSQLARTIENLVG